MSDVMHIRSGEAGIVRLFALDLDDKAARAFTADDVARAVSTGMLDAQNVDIIAIADLQEIGLFGYLRDGIGIEESELALMATRLETLKGHVVLIRSAAFAGRAATLAPKAPLRWIASFGEPPIDLTAAPLKSEAARGILGGGSDAPVPKRSKTLAILLAALCLIVLAVLYLATRSAS